MSVEINGTIYAGEKAAASESGEWGGWNSWNDPSNTNSISSFDHSVFSRAPVSMSGHTQPKDTEIPSLTVLATLGVSYCPHSSVVISRKPFPQCFY